VSSSPSTEPTIEQLFDLSGKVALFTGGTGWLGSSMSRALAEAGASVVISSRNLSRAQGAAERLPSPCGARHYGVELDHMAPDSIRQGFQKARDTAGAIDVLVNNGVDQMPEDLTNCTFEGFARTQLNNAGYFELARLLRNHAVDRKTPGCIILLGSMYGVVGAYPDAYEGICPASSVTYHALKGGTVHLTRHLAAFWARDRVRVNCLSPGPFPNPEHAPAAMIERLETKCPMHRMGKPSELKGAIVFLASDASSYMTGQNLIIDGGWTSW